MTVLLSSGKNSPVIFIDPDGLENFQFQNPAQYLWDSVGGNSWQAGVEHFDHQMKEANPVKDPAALVSGVISSAAFFPNSVWQRAETCFNTEGNSRSCNVLECMFATFFLISGKGKDWMRYVERYDCIHNFN